jgi:uncharacterized protein (UPF0248 family)
LPHRWVDFTKTFSGDAFGKSYRPIIISFGSKHAVSICCCKFRSAKLSSLLGANRYVKGESKFKGGDKVIKRLVYQASIQTDKKYTVCYEDRYLGIVESEVTRFYHGSDIPLHRIQMFKCDGTVIWDRKRKFTLI